MVYEFHKVRKLRSELFVVFSKAAEDGRKEFLAVGINAAARGSFIQARDVSYNAFTKVRLATILHDCDFPEQRLYTPAFEQKLA